MNYDRMSDSLLVITSPSNQVILSSLKAITPSTNKGYNRIEAMGYLTYNPNYSSSISARIAGRIEKTYVKYNFQLVTKGQKLLDLYSPEILTTQNEYLLLYKLQEKGDSISITSLYNKLLHLGMSKHEIKSIETSGKTTATISIYAPISGHIHFNDAGTNMSEHGIAWPTENPSMNQPETKTILTEGDYLKKDELIYTIADDSKLWALFKILPSDISLIEQGNKVEVSMNDEILNGSVDFIEKDFDPSSDFYSVRVYLECKDHTSLKVGTLTKGYIKINSSLNKEKIWIPSKAFITIGKDESAVFIKQKIGYSAKSIQTGISMGDWTAVVSGLSIKDSIAPVASYLVDSEAFIITP